MIMLSYYPALGCIFLIRKGEFFSVLLGRIRLYSVGLLQLFVSHADFAGEDFSVVFKILFEQGRGVQLVGTANHACTAADAVLDFFHFRLPVIIDP